MKRYILTLSFASLIAGSSLGANEPHPAINPALLYWQAAALLPTLNDAEAKELRDVAGGQGDFDPKEMAKILPEGTVLHLIEEAATSTAPCDWGLLTEDGPMCSLPHVAKVRQIASIAIVKAEALFADGKTKEGVQWLLSAHRIARHAGAGDLLITYLVQNVLETNAIRAAARHCLEWDEPLRQSYAKTLNALPPLHSIGEALQGEHVLIDWVERRVETAESEHDLDQFVAAMGMDKSVDHNALMAQLRPDTMRATAAEWRGIMDRLDKAAAKPWAISEPELKVIMTEVFHSPHPLIRETIPSIEAVAQKWRILATLHTMLDAALVHGTQLDEATAATYRDSLEGEPLRFTKTPDGALTLSAAHPHPVGKDLSLKFGK
jgi:hypothetical protein